MPDTIILAVHLSTDPLTGGLTIDFDPVEYGGLGPIGHVEWADTRGRLRDRIREKIADEDRWTPYLHADRPGERLDVEIGRATITADGDIVSTDITITDPSGIEWP